MVDDRPCRTGLGSQPGFAPRNLPSRGRRIAEVSKATRTPMFRLCQLVPGNPRNRKCYVQVSLDGSRPSSLKLGGWGDIARSALGDAHVRRLHRLWMPRDRALRDRTTGGQRGDGALLVKLVDPHARLRADPAIAEYSGIHPVQLYCDDRRQQKRAGRHRGSASRGLRAVRHRSRAIHGRAGRWVCLRTWPRDGRDDCGHRSAGGAAVGRVGRRPSSRRGIPVVSAVR